MNCRQQCWLLLICIGLFAFSGANCAPWLQRNPTASQLPRVLSVSPTLDEVIKVVNNNSTQIQSFSTNRATISGQGFPTLHANIAFERPKRLRLRADLAPMGTQLDLGSNDDLFWFWAKENKPQTMFFCRHDQFATSNARRMTPFDPQWLIEAVGIMEFDPNLPHQGPFPEAKERLRIDTIRETPQGPVSKVTILDASQGWVLEQHQYDVNRQLVASSYASQHRRDPLTGLIMPTVVQIDCPQAKLKMQIYLGNVEINRLMGDPAALWTMPTYPNARVVDMADPNFQLPVAVNTRRPVIPPNNQRSSR